MRRTTPYATRGPPGITGLPPAFRGRSMDEELDPLAPRALDAVRRRDGDAEADRGQRREAAHRGLRPGRRGHAGERLAVERVLPREEVLPVEVLAQEGAGVGVEGHGARRRRLRHREDGL